ncbi:cytochrome P450 [Mollisia scopiformis]|uniref:Cytochrome P450 n=1 Tax=Mollisia scopiformis TaxID=149040 RepID=A0A194X028_MOLSC|nr:cytochrome P450 [Mollisia scopiformis]KUJ13551.1 cytochrome P450 [Mollisia scopiformis]
MTPDIFPSPGNLAKVLALVSLLPNIYKDPVSFHPERFLGDERFEDDDREALQPFHVGPRNCLGKNLAYTEMRLILARVIWNFDMELSEGGEGWLEGQRPFNLWDKGPLMVRLMVRKG